MLALLFPGQGAQSAGFLHRLPDHPAVAATIDEASDTLSLDIRTLDSDAALRSSVAVQIGLVVAGVALVRRLASEGIEPDVCAGLSVGAYAAAVACEAVDFADALVMVKRRAELMEQAYPRGYGLSVIDGLPEHRIEALASGSTNAGGSGTVYVANVNAPRQIVVAGADAALDAFNETALAAGAHRAKRLAVSVPSHCVLLAQASDALIEFARTIAFRAPRAQYVGNRTARVLHNGDAIRDDLATNMRYTVRWYDALTLMIELGAKHFVEAAPGQVLTDITRCAYPCVTALAASVVGDEQLLQHVRRWLDADHR
jgi:malonate decarboxylase epsilon subunit